MRLFPQKRHYYLAASERPQADRDVSNALYEIGTAVYSLCLAIVRAHRWRDLIESGEVSSISRLAETLTMTLR